jgi:hypothetical protein
MKKAMLKGQKAKYAAWDIIAEVQKELNEHGKVSGWASKPYDIGVVTAVRLEAAGIKFSWMPGHKP